MASLGILEVCGYSTALLAINKMLHESEIKIVAIDIDKPAVAELDRIPLVAQVKFTGSVDQVQEALKAGKAEALKYNGEDEVIAQIITNFHEDLTDLIKITKIKK